MRRARAGAWFFAVLAAVAASMLWVDRPLLLWITQHRTPEVVRVFDAITVLGKGSVAWSALLVMGVALWLSTPGARTPLRVHAWISAVLALATSGLVVRALKFLCGRPRPKAFLEQGAYGFTGPDFTFDLSSFPSGHTQTAFALCVVLALWQPRWRPVCMVVACAIAMSRLVLGSHYMSDVLMGAYVGSVCAILCWHVALVRRWSRWQGSARTAQ